MPLKGWLRGRSRLLSLTLSFAVLSPTVLRADSTGTAADVVPGDCISFATTLRLREQWNLFYNSQAYQRNAKALVERAWAEIKKEAAKDPKGQQAFAVLESPQAQSAMAFTCDLIGDECFTYMDHQWLGFAEKLGKFPERIFAGYFQAAFGGKPPKPERIIVPALVDFLVDSEIKLPPVVMGFKAKNPQAVLAHLEKLREAGSREKLKFEKVSLNGGEYTTWKLNGKMIPIPEDKLVEALTETGVTEQRAKDFYAWIGDQVLFVTAGVRGDYVVLSIAGSNEHLNSLGKKPLSETAFLNPIRKHLKSGPLLSLNYVSLELASLGATDIEKQKKDLDQAGAMAAMFLPPGLGPRLIADLKELFTDIDAASAKPSEVVDISIRNKGVEHFHYTRAVDKSRDFSRPLDVLKHAGGEPFLAVAQSNSTSIPGYTKTVNYLKKFYGYARDFGYPKLKQENKEAFEKFQKYEAVVLPFLGRLDEITSRKLIPSVDRSQDVFALDFSSKAKKFGPQELPKAMPVPELALYCAINDGDMLRESIVDYVDAVNGFYDKMRPLIIADGGDAEKLPAKLPIKAPTSKSAGEGTIYYYPLPIPLDEAILPHVQLGKKYLVISSSPSLASRMVAAGEMPKGTVVSLSEAASQASIVNPAPLYSFLREWIGFAKSAPNGPFAQAKPEEREIAEKVLAAAGDLMGAFRGSVETVTKEGEYEVTHGWGHFEDVSK